ncbi:MAG: GNAT family N-acetyltransferase [Pseudomonadota bacterium]
MQPLTLAEFEAAAEAYDAAVAAGDDTDRFCTASHWILSAPGSVSALGDPWFRRGEAGWIAALLRRTTRGLRVIGGLEQMWGFCCPLVGLDPHRLAVAFAADLALRRKEWDFLHLCGLPPDGPLLASLAESPARGPLFEVTPGIVRDIASLRGGLDGYLARRTRAHRKALRRAGRLAAEAGVALEHHRRGDAAALMARILDVEVRSWKGQQRVGIESGRMRAFYTRMLPRLERAGRLRLVFATRDGRDLAYCLGGVFGGTLRGLQQSYDAACAELSLGSLCQLHLVRTVCADGDALRYDLGMDKDYKHRWAERRLQTVNLLAR